ncbi:MAG TPA: hypothetical protein VK487_10770 [Candidatus Bathyarchaeia archaeon]|nr:hypothetical protein [Candidatus Bathyarchaeia archaeon]
MPAQTKIEIPRIRVGKKQEIQTLINEKAMLLGIPEKRKERMDSKNRNNTMAVYCAPTIENLSTDLRRY